MVIPSLQHGGYECEIQAKLGTRLGTGRHVVDGVVTNKRTGERFLLSVKWQQVSGTAEQKVPFEIICLADALAHHGEMFGKAYLVLGGPGWSLRDTYLSGGLGRYLRNTELVTVLTLEDFVARANSGLL
jgi:hypothetical protein